MTDALIGHFRLLARYNAGANERLYDACARLDDDERKRPRRAFFGSIHGTLNHILLGDRIWLARFAGAQVPSTDLDAILYEDFDALREARGSEDTRLLTFAQRLTPAFLAGSIRYINNQGLTFDDPVPTLLAHLFNHQTHHRGQVHGMLSQTAVAPPELDLHRVAQSAAGRPD